MKSKSEGLYVIPLKRIYWGGSRRTRGRRAIKYIRDFIARHFNAEKVIIDSSINEYIHSFKLEKPPRRIVVRVKRLEENIYKASLALEV